MITIIKSEIDEPFWGTCEFPSKWFPFGFEFCFDTFIAARAEDDYDNAVDHCWSPGGRHVTVRSLGFEADDVVKHFKLKRVEWDDESEHVLSFDIPYEDCPLILGLSHWKLCDIVWKQEEEEMEHAFMNHIMARDYTETKYKI